jgi:phosphotriesterase-related protein
MGITLPHEHILVDFIGADSTGPHRWDKEKVVSRATPFLEEVRDLGCRTFIECTPAYVGRDPVLLKMLSEKTGLHIITNTGFYGAGNNHFIPDRAFSMTAEELAGEWIREYREGIGDTGIRPGFIKIAVDREDSLSPMHEKLIRAAAITHLETGLVIKSHTGTDAPAFNQLAVLEEVGVPAHAFIWTHAQGGTPEGWKKAAESGTWISLDHVNENGIEKYLESLQIMKDAGYLDRVLISHDSGWYRVGQENGGKYNGYTVIFEALIPALRDKGFSEDEIRQLIVHNPARAFGLEK